MTELRPYNPYTSGIQSVVAQRMRCAPSTPVTPSRMVYCLTACLTILAGAMAGEARAQDSQISANEFVGAMTGCLDWIEAGSPDDTPFDDWTVVVDFPNSDASSGRLVGLYERGETGFTVTLERSDAEGVVCASFSNGPLEGDVADRLSGWAHSEVARGRIGRVPAHLTEDFGAEVALCVGDQGILEIVGNADVAMGFFFLANARVMPPEGVCNA